MTSRPVNFMSYNSTGLDSEKSKWINDIIKTFNVSFFQLQEHFKIIKTIDRLFKKEFPSCDSYVIPGFREPFQEGGRAKGGLAQLCGGDLGVKKERIITKHWRIQAQILHFNGYKLMWINCYFPTDPQTLNFDDQELREVQDNIENILDNNLFDDCILGGDFNFDSRRVTGFTSSMADFLSRLGLISVWEKFPIDFTHLHTDLKSSSILDNFFVNQRLLDMVVDAGPVHLGDNRSRHSPVMMKINLPDIPVKEEQPESRPIRRPAWYKAAPEEKLLYTQVLDEKLRQLIIPESLRCCNVNCKCKNHIEERDKYVLDILCTIIETSYECIPLSGKAPKSKSSWQPLPGWKEHVAPLKKDSLFWHSVWISAGRPSQGTLYQVMLHTRAKYHVAVKKAKRLAASAKAQNILDASEKGDYALMAELRKILDTKSKGQTVPESLDGKVTHDTILERFRECYEELYNSAGSEAAMTGIKEKLEGLIKGSSIHEVSKITGGVVKAACSRMRAGKMDVSESYSSDALLHGPDVLFELLAGVFRSFLVHGSVTLQLLSCAFLPLYKGGFKNPGVFDSYRAIAGGSQMLKLFEYVVLVIWGDRLDTDSLQFGFKSG